MGSATPPWRSSDNTVGPTRAAASWRTATARSEQSRSTLQRESNSSESRKEQGFQAIRFAALHTIQVWRNVLGLHPVHRQRHADRKARRNQLSWRSPRQKRKVYQREWVWKPESLRCTLSSAVGCRRFPTGNRLLKKCRCSERRLSERLSIWRSSCRGTSGCSCFPFRFFGAGTFSRAATTRLLSGLLVLRPGLVGSPRPPMKVSSASRKPRSGRAGFSLSPCAVTRDQLRRQGRRAPVQRARQTGCQHHDNPEDPVGGMCGRSP